MLIHRSAALSLRIYSKHLMIQTGKERTASRKTRSCSCFFLSIARNFHKPANVTSKTQKMLSSSGTLERSRLQNVIVMRHGDRIDNAEPLWIASAPRPWDPPLAQSGKIRAWNTGKKLRKNLGFKIDRVLVSPFLRCVETASQVITALCAQGDFGLMETSENAIVDPSRVKVSIEYGLCESLSREAIHIDVVPKDGNWILDLSELEAMLPAGTLDHTVERVFKEMPKWEEPIEISRRRYREVIMALADKYPHENLLLVTHGRGIATFDVGLC